MNTLIRLLLRLDRCDWYVMLWCIVQLEGVLHIEGVISQVFQALLLGWALYDGGRYLLPNKGNPLMLQATNVLMLMYIIYGLVFIIESPAYYTEDPYYFYMKTFIVSFLPIFMFYKYSIVGYLTEEKIRVYTGIFLLTVILQYYHLGSSSGNISSEETTNNYGYLFLSLFPSIFFLYQKRLLQYFMLGVLVVFVLLSMKRGAIVVCAVCFIWFLWDSIKHSTSVKHKYTTFFLGTVLTVGAFSSVVYMLATSEYFNRRIEETQKGDSSGRDVLYTKLYDAIVNDDSYVHLFLGRGAYSTYDVVHKMAHNDWLETACNNGLLGIMCVLLFLISFYRTAVQAKYVFKPETSSALQMSFFIFAIRMFFSMSLQEIPIYITIIISYSTYCIEKAKETT